ncbi:MAG: RNA 2',3'-cyclic phosphodiesterase [Dehalococcoidia bacterium]|nr:RNA 2',3'-cyclic phosphodiesterase [Dehalococcoidia bacterium]
MPSSPGRIRSFIAIELPLEVRKELAMLRKEMERGGHRFVRWVNVDGIHLTLKFLGDISFEQVAEITEVMAKSRRGISSFQLELAGLGGFPDLKRPRIIWVGISGEVNQLLKLQRSLDLSLASLGFAREMRPFTAHLTLARVNQGISSVQLNSLGGLIAATEFEGKRAFEVDSVNLMRSHLTGGGAVYSCLSSVALED